MQHLEGIQSKMVATKRIRSHCLFSGSESGVPVIFMHGNLSSATFFEEVMVAMPSKYWCIAPDMRGYGDSEGLPIDATRGVRDLADDLHSLLNTLEIQTAHLVGWSAGAGAIMQFALDHTARVDTLCFIAPVSPFGFGGTCDIQGTPTSVDFAGSGAGTVSAESVEQLRLGDTGISTPTSPRQLLRNYFLTSTVRLQREDILINAMLKQKLGDRHYPGDYQESPHPPHVAPGEWGPLNALSPKYFNASALVSLLSKPPVLWVRGALDYIVSDNSLFDLAAINHRQALTESDPSIAESIRPQPMVGQMRELLCRYAQNGGQFEEVVMMNAGHSPFMEERDIFLQRFTEFLSRD